MNKKRHVDLKWKVYLWVIKVLFDTGDARARNVVAIILCN
jgi:hypothetical protein